MRIARPVKVIRVQNRNIFMNKKEIKTNTQLLLLFIGINDLIIHIPIQLYMLDAVLRRISLRLQFTVYVLLQLHASNQKQFCILRMLYLLYVRHILQSAS